MKKFLFILLLGFLLHADEFTLPHGMDTDAQIFQALSETFKGKTGDYYKRTIKRVGDNTITFEAQISVEADAKIMSKVIGDVPKYNDWALTNINQAPGSKLNYLLKIYRFILDPKEPNSVRPEFMVDLPGFRKLTNRRFDYTTEQKGDVFTITAITPEDKKSHIEKATTQLKLFPAPLSQRVWLYVTSKIKLRYWLLYEALPTRILEKESMERIQTVLDNYQVQEDRLRNSSGNK